MNIITALFNRAAPVVEKLTNAVSGWLPEAVTLNPADRLGDPLYSLTAYRVHFEYRGNMNRGEYTMPAWALFNAAQALPIIGDKVSFWAASIAGMDYDIRLSEIVKDKPELKMRAEAQQETLKAAYNKQQFQEMVRHLALARFYGYSVLSRKAQMEPLDHWNILRDGLHGSFYWNPTGLIGNARSMPKENRLDINNSIIRVCDDYLILKCLRIYLRAMDIEDWWDKNLEAESRRQVIVLTSRAPKGEETNYRDAAKNIAAGRSGYIAAGDGTTPTQIIFPPASRGLVYYSERLKVLDEQLTRALTGSTLTTLTAPGSGTLAGEAHEKTVGTILSAEAGEISETLQEQFDKPLLTAQGLLVAGESPLAYVSLRTSKATDPAKEIAWTAQLAVAGIQRDRVELEERTGMKLIGGATGQQTPQDAPQGTQPAQPIPGQGQAEILEETALNGAQVTSLVSILSQAATGAIPIESAAPIIRAAFPAISEETIEKIIGPLRGFTPKQQAETIANRSGAGLVADKIAVPEEWLAPVRDRLNEMEKRLTAGDATLEQAQAEMQAVIDALPELFESMDTAALADTLAKAMLDAVKKGG
jgi:hypothetical protein